MGVGSFQHRRLHLARVRTRGGQPRRLHRARDIGTGPLGTIGNLVWLVLAGWWLALAHLVIALGLAITIIGLPFAWAHLKLAGIALWPIGKMIVPIDERELCPLAPEQHLLIKQKNTGRPRVRERRRAPRSHSRAKDAFCNILQSHSPGSYRERPVHSMRLRQILVFTRRIAGWLSDAEASALRLSFQREVTRP